MFWRKKSRSAFDKNNFEYEANHRQVRMVNGQLHIDADQYAKEDYPATYDLAICLGAAIDQITKGI